MQFSNESSRQLFESFNTTVSTLNTTIKRLEEKEKELAAARTEIIELEKAKSDIKNQSKKLFEKTLKRFSKINDRTPEISFINGAFRDLVIDFGKSVEISGKSAKVTLGQGIEGKNYGIMVSTLPDNTFKMTLFYDDHCLHIESWDYTCAGKFANIYRDVKEHIMAVKQSLPNYLTEERQKKFIEEHTESHLKDMLSALVSKFGNGSFGGIIIKSDNPPAYENSDVNPVNPDIKSPDVNETPQSGSAKETPIDEDFVTVENVKE